MNIGGGYSHTDFDLNITPIIDCFVVLITYLLVSASFLTLQALDVEVAANGEAQSAVPSDPPLMLSVELGMDRAIELKVSGGRNKENVVLAVAPLSDKRFDLEALRTRISEIQKKWPELEGTNVSAAPLISYREMVKAIDIVKKNNPKIYLAP